MQLAADHLYVNIDGNPILKDVNMSVGGKTFVGLIGPNGSGKSTLLKCLYRVIRPSQGMVSLDGKPLSGYSMKESARRIAVVAQHNYYHFDFSVWDVVMMGRAPHKKALERDNLNDFQIVEGALSIVGMWNFRRRNFSTLSGGEQQRVILARALAQQTLCLILDEPTNHLDIKYQLELMDLVKGLDVTVLAAIHDLNIASMYCDTLYAMKDGEIAGCGTPETLLTTDFIRELFEVETQILYDQSKKIHILYHPTSFYE